MEIDDITSDEVDALLEDAETVHADRPAGGTEIRLYVGVNAETSAKKHRAPLTSLGPG